MNTTTAYLRLAELPPGAKIAQLEAVGKDVAWRIILFEKDSELPNALLSVYNIFEAVELAPLTRMAVTHLPERCWVAYRGGKFAELHLPSNHYRTNARYLNGALRQAHITPPFAEEPRETPRKVPGSLPSIADAQKLMSDPDQCSLAVRLECHQVRLRRIAPIVGADKSEEMASALADLCQGVQMLLGDRAE